MQSSSARIKRVTVELNARGILTPRGGSWQLACWRGLRSDGERRQKVLRERILQKLGVKVAVALVAAAVNQPKAVLTTEQPEAHCEQIYSDYYAIWKPLVNRAFIPHVKL
jgi:hypothetical protein